MRALTPAISFVLLITAAGGGNAQTFPPKADVRPYVETDGVATGGTVRVALAVSLPEGLHVQSNQPRDPQLIPTRLWIDPPAGVAIRQLIYPVPTDFQQEGIEQPLAVFEREFVLGAALEVASSAEPGPLVISGRLRYQPCDEQVCYRPIVAPVQWTVHVGSAGGSGVPVRPEVFEQLARGRVTSPAGDPPPELDAPRSAVVANDTGLAMLDRFTVLGTAGGYLGSGSFLQFVRDSETGVVRQGLFEGRGPLAVLLLVFAGGMALNLTPCVLPMIPVNLAIIGAGAQAGTRRRGFLLGSAYGGAMALVYGLLGLVVILTAGTFGTINASPWFNAAIAALFVVLGLAMFDVLPIDFSRYSSRVGVLGSRGTFTVAFTMGAVAAALAGACVAPVVIQVVLFSSSLYAAGTTLALALPFVLGAGMGVPWAFAGTGLAALPKPGRWMLRVKQAFGLLILATAVYYGQVAYGLFADRWVDASAVSASVREKLKSGWTDSLAEGLAIAERDQKPVLVDFWATWCKNCLAMDKTTFEDPEVTAALAGYVKVKFQAEDPDGEPARSLMARFQAVGLPTYVILQPAQAGSAADARRTSIPGGS